MIGSYDVLWNQMPVGKVQVGKDGLYYVLDCRCRMPDRDLYKISVVCGGKTRLLGTLTPCGQEMILRKRLPAKLFSNEIPQFYAVRKENERFVPICDHEPFPYLEQLKNACLEERNGYLGIVIRQ